MWQQQNENEVPWLQKCHFIFHLTILLHLIAENYTAFCVIEIWVTEAKNNINGRHAYILPYIFWGKKMFYQWLECQK